MHGACLDYPLYKWFDFKTPKPSVPADYIVKALEEEEVSNKPTAKVFWMGKLPAVETFTKSKKGSQWEMCSLTFQTKKETFNIKVNEPEGNWLYTMLKKFTDNGKLYSLQEVKDDYEAAGLDNFELFWDNKPVNTLYKAGLLQL
jgi:hypothetical protein